MTTDDTSLSGNADLAGDRRTATAPYMSFNGFRDLLDRFGREGLPQVFDRSFFGDQSGSLIAQTRGTLKFFDLIDQDRRPTEQLREIAGTDETKRIEILRKLAEEKYANVIALGGNATQGQLSQTFSSAGLSGASITKAIAFYMGLAEYVNLPVSPFFKKSPARSSSNGGSVRRSSRRRKPPSPPAAPSVEQAQRQLDPIEVKKSAYIDLLMKLAEQSTENGQVQQDLLDRLERALGYETSPRQKGE